MSLSYREVTIPKQKNVCQHVCLFNKLERDCNVDLTVLTPQINWSGYCVERGCREGEKSLCTDVSLMIKCGHMSRSLPTTQGPYFEDISLNFVSISFCVQ